MPYSLLSSRARTILEIIAGLGVILSTIFCCLLVYFLATTQRTTLSRRYRILLGTIQLHAYTLEIGTYVLLHPIPLVPLSCFHFDSWMLHLLGIDGHVLFECFLTYFLLITIPYGLCFTYRHQMIQAPLSKFKFRRRTIAIAFSIYAAFVILTGIFHTSTRDTAEVLAASFVRKTFGDGIESSLLEQTNCYKLVNPIVYFILVAILFTICALFVGVVTGHIFYILHHQNYASIEKRRQYWSWMKMLLIQATTPFAIIAIPCSILNIQFVCHIGDPELAGTAIAMLMFHSSSYSIVVILTTAQYRRRVIRCLCDWRRALAVMADSDSHRSNDG